MFPSLRKEKLMADGQRRHITQRPDGQWADKAEGNDRASGLYDTQRQAQQAATDALNSRPGGGEGIIHRPNGEIRGSNTINRPDPFPPRG
jgi:Uncharacterized protein conserved in bacteria (DUF2188)